MYTIPADGSSNSSFFFGPTTGEFLDEVFLTNSSIYITTENQTTLDVTFSVSLLSAASFSPLATGDIWIDNPGTIADRMFYNLEDNATGDTEAAYRTDAGSATVLSQSRWIGGVLTEMDLTQTFGLNKMVLARNYTNVSTGLNGATVVVIDALTGAEELTMGTINEDLVNAGFFGFNPMAAGFGFTFNSTTMQIETDVYFLDINQANSWVNVTNTPDINETPGYF